MTTRTVGGTVTRANGLPIASAPIVIELVLAEAFVVTGSYSMGGTLTLQTAADGTWSTPLQCNDDLTPVGTLYQVTEKIPSAYGGAKVYLIQVLTGLPGGATINQILNLVVPAAVPVGGSYAPVGSGPKGDTGASGFIQVADNAAALALPTKTAGQNVWILSTSTLVTWNGVEYRIITPGSIPTGSSVFFSGTTSGTTSLTLGTISIAAIEFRRTIMIFGTLYVTKTVATDVFDFSVTADGTSFLKARIDANLNGPVSLPPFGGNVIIPNSAITITFALQRISGTGTASPSETSGIYSRGEYRLRPL